MQSGIATGQNNMPLKQILRNITHCGSCATSRSFVTDPDRAKIKQLLHYTKHNHSMPEKRNGKGGFSLLN